MKSKSNVQTIVMAALGAFLTETSTALTALKPSEDESFPVGSVAVVKEFVDGTNGYKAGTAGVVYLNQDGTAQLVVGPRIGDFVQVDNLRVAKPAEAKAALKALSEKRITSLVRNIAQVANLKFPSNTFNYEAQKAIKQ